MSAIKDSPRASFVPYQTRDKGRWGGGGGHGPRAPRTPCPPPAPAAHCQVLHPLWELPKPPRKAEEEGATPCSLWFHPGTTVVGPPGWWDPAAAPAPPVPGLYGTEAQHGVAQHGAARHGVVQHGMAWCGSAWHGTARYGTAWHSMAWYGMAQHGMAYHSQTQHGMAQHGMGMARHR